MAKPAVLFGGPSDEHDISILTGLQVAAGPRQTCIPSTGRRPGTGTRSTSGLEASDFVDGVPRKAREIDFVAAPGKGLVLKKRPLDIDRGAHCLSRRARGGRHPPGNASTLPGFGYTGPGQAASALGMDKLGFGAAMAAAGLPTLARALVASGYEPAPDFRRAFHRQAAFRGVVDRDRGR